jgi:hypothetical protein
VFTYKKVLVLSDDYFGSIKHSLDSMGVTIFIASRKNIQIDGANKCIFSGDDTAVIIDSLQEANFRPDFIFVSAERYVRIKSLLCEYYSIPYLPYTHTGRVIDKSEMRKIVAEKEPDMTPAFATVTSPEDITKFINRYGLPAMIKPTSLLKSLFVTKVTTTEEALKAFQSIQDRAVSHNLSGRLDGGAEQEVIIEEFMVGKKFSIEGVVDHSGIGAFPHTVTDVYFGYDNERMNDPACYATIVPSSEKTATQQELFDATQCIITALDIRDCPIHAEMIMTRNGIKLIEIAARIGGFREKLYSLSFGYSLIASDFQIQLGQPADLINLKPNKTSYSAIVKVYSYKEGILEGLNNEDILTNLKSYYSHVRKAADGDRVGPSKLGYTEILNVVLNDKSIDNLSKDKESILDSITPVLKPN